MMLFMRTTLTIRDEIAEALQKKAFQSGKSFKDTVNEILQTGLTATHLPPQTKAYTLEPSHLGGTPTNIDLDKTLQLADTLEDEEIVRKLQLRK